MLTKLCEFHLSNRDTFKETKPKPSSMNCFIFDSMLETKLSFRLTDGCDSLFGQEYSVSPNPNRYKVLRKWMHRQ